ncbi:MAG: SatD family protein [Acidimicrobiia bacterium]
MTATRRNWAALIGDVVGSRQARNRAQLQRQLERALDRVNRSTKPEQSLTGTVGDEFQGLYSTVEEALDASLLLHLEMIGRARLRIGIGWGALRIRDPERSPFAQDGPCWWRARESLEELARSEQSHQEPDSLRTVCRTGNAKESAYNSLLVLRDQVLAAVDEADATIMRILIDGGSQQKAAREIGVNKSSVSRRMQTHGLAALLRARKHLADA